MTRSSSAPPIDRGWAWVVVFGVFMNMFFMMGIAKSCGIFMVEFIDKFQVSATYGGTAIGVASVLFALGSPVAGVLGESVTHRKIVLFGGVIGMFGYSMCSLLYNMPYIIVFYAVGFGFGNCCSYGSGMVMLGKYFRKKRSTATGIALSGTSVGQFAMPPIIEYLLETYQLGGTLLIIGALYFHCSLAGALFRPIGNEDIVESCDEFCETEAMHKPVEEPEGIEEKSKHSDNIEYHGHETVLLTSDDIRNDLGNTNGTTLTVPGTTLNRQKLKVTRELGLTNSCSSLYYAGPMIVPDKNGSIKTIDNTVSVPKKSFNSYLKRVIDFSIIRNYVVVYFVLISFCGFFGLYNFVVFSPAIVVEKGMTKYDKAMLVSICGIGDLIARIGVGYFADRNYIERYKLKALTAVLGGLNMIVFIFANSFTWLAILCFISGLTAGAYVCLMPVVMLDFIGLDLLSEALGMAILAQGLGGALGQPVLGSLVDLTGSYSIVLVFGAILLILSGILLMFTPCVWRLEQKRNARKRTNESET